MGTRWVHDMKVGRKGGHLQVNLLAKTLLLLMMMMMKMRINEEDHC